jgi:hypothetical protein
MNLPEAFLSGTAAGQIDRQPNVDLTVKFDCYGCGGSSSWALMARFFEREQERYLNYRLL